MRGEARSARLTKRCDWTTLDLYRPLLKIHSHEAGLAAEMGRDVHLGGNTDHRLPSRMPLEFLLLGTRVSEGLDTRRRKEFHSVFDAGSFSSQEIPDITLTR